MRRAPRLAACLTLALAIVCGTSGFGGPDPGGDLVPGRPPLLRPAHAPGYVLPEGADPEAVALALAPPAVAGDAGAPGPVWQVVRVAWRDGETSPGRLDASRWDPAIDAAARAGQPVLVVISGGFPADEAAEPERLDAHRRNWNAFLRETARRWAGRVAAFAVDGALPRPEAENAALAAAYEIKSAAVTLTAEAPASGFWIRVRDEGEAALVERAFEESADLVPYLDGLLFAGTPEEDLARRVGEARRRWLQLDPAAVLAGETSLPAGLSRDELDDEALARVSYLLAAGADLAVLDATPAVAVPPGPALPAARSLSALAALLGPAYGLAPAEGRGLSFSSAAGEVRWAYFFDEERFREALLFWAGDGVTLPAEAMAVVERRLRREISLFDPLGRLLTPPAIEPAGEGQVSVRVPLARRPLMLIIQREKTSPGIELEEEVSEARGQKSVTAEEIIAAHQRFQAFQDDRLRSVRRPGTISFRVRVGAATGTLDLGVKADQFWDPSTGPEWVILDTYFNGVKLNWDRFPELPFVSREKIVAVPLDLNLDRRYDYRYQGAEEVEGRMAWRLSFEPLAETVSLYRGTAWIDQRTAALLKVRLRYTKTEAPLISDEETQTYRPFEGPDGTAFWLPDLLEGQQIYTVAGANLVVLREIRFGAPTINDPGFEAARAAAYASDRQMLRDTDTGFKWLSKDESGERRLLERGDPTQWFAVAGALYDAGTDGVVPLAGVNYVDVDFRGRKEIFNAFLAGAVNNLTWTDPSFLDTRLDAGINLNLVTFASTDRTYELGEEIEREAVRSISQSLRLPFGYPIGEFAKVRATLGVDYTNFRTADTTEEFVLPPDHFLYSGSLQLGLDRGGWSFSLGGTLSQRSRWEAWGPEGDLTPADEASRAKSFSTWQASIQRSFFLPYFQKIEVSAEWLAGRDLDRFSEFQFGLFGDNRLPGFGGSGIRFESGGVLELQYAFNLAEVVGFDVSLEHAEVDDPQVAAGLSGHTGIGLAANLAGPWETLWRLDAGYALASDLPSASGTFDFLFVVLKLF